jgi:hypothetical protein
VVPSLAPAFLLHSTAIEEKNERRVADLNEGSLNSAARPDQTAGQDRAGENAVPESDKPLVSGSSLEKARVGVSRQLAVAGSAIAVFLILGLAICSFTLWQQLRAARQALYPWRNSPAVSGLWGTFLGEQKETDLVVTDSSFSLVEALTNRSFNLNDYLSHSYMNQLQDQDPKMAAALSRISNWGLGSSGEFEAAQRILTLDPTRQKLHFYLARKYQPDLIRKDNVILIGSRYGNPWAELFQDRMNFTFDLKSQYEILNLAPKAGEPAAYDFSTSSSVGFCIIAYLPNPANNGSALLIQGTSGEPTQAGVDFLLSEAKLSSLQKTLGASRLPYFELLLKTSWVKGTPIDSNVVAYRTYPGPH